MKKAYIFPGQGSQFPGMAAELYNNNSQAKELFEEANEILGFRITDIMFNGSAEELKATNVTQPAVFLHSSILAKCYSTTEADMLAGHSLGEFSALTASGAIEFKEALNLVAFRAKEMQKCCEKNPGTMAAILGLNSEELIKICKECNGIVVPANFNCGGQIVISGELKAVEEACNLAKERGAKRALQLPVGGAFHSPLMKDAEIELGYAIKHSKFVEAKIPVYQNVTALAETNPDKIRENLLKQLSSSVLWTQTVSNMLEANCRSFLEIGAGNVLQGLVRKIVIEKDLNAEVEISGISSC